MSNSSSTPSATHGFGGRLKTARKQAGLTQEELASKASLSTITLSKLESGANKPSFDVIVALCQSMNIDPNFFFGWSTEISVQHNSERRMKLQSLILNAEKLDDAWLDELVSISRLARKKF